MKTRLAYSTVPVTTRNKKVRHKQRDTDTHTKRQTSRHTRHYTSVGILSPSAEVDFFEIVKMSIDFRATRSHRGVQPLATALKSHSH